MGFMSNSKNSTISADAKSAWDEGATVFSAILNYPNMNTGNSSGVDAWTAELTEVEKIGWKLSSWSVAPDRRGNLVAFPLFKR